MENINFASIAIGLAVGAIITFILVKVLGGNSKSKAAKIIEDANAQAKTIIKKLKKNLKKENKNYKIKKQNY